MPSTADLARWRKAVARLLDGPAPRGETFDLCRRVVASDATPEMRCDALRILLEGAMADALTEVGVAQDVMGLLRARDRGDVNLQAMLTVP